MVTAVKMTLPEYPVYDDVDPTYIDNIESVGLRKNPLYVLGWWARDRRCK
jgi:hypothetical protein